MKRFIEIEIIKSGQQRAYGDSIYEGYLRYSSEGLWASELPIDVAKKEAQVLIHEFVEKDDPKREWYQAYLDECKKTAEKEYYFKIIEPYDD